MFKQKGELNESAFLVLYGNLFTQEKASTLRVYPLCLCDRCNRYFENTINIFIHAPMEARVKRIMALYHLDEAAAIKAITTSDKERGNHYFRYTDMKWGKAQNYDICVNSALMGVEKTAEMLAKLAQIEERA